MSMFVCPDCRKESFEIKVKMALATGDSDEKAVQLVKCLSCEKCGVFWYEEDTTQGAWLHRGYALSQEAWDKLFARLELCPDNANKRCKCETHTWLTSMITMYGIGEDIELVFPMFRPGQKT